MWNLGEWEAASPNPQAVDRETTGWRYSVK